MTTPFLKLKKRIVFQTLFLRNILSLIQGIVPNNGISIGKLVRSATDREIFVISRILGVPMEKLFENATEK